MEKPLDVAGVGPHVGWPRVSGSHEGGGNDVGQADGGSDMAPACVSTPGGGERGLDKGAVASVSASVWGDTVPPALALEPDNSVPPYVSLAPFELLPQRWTQSERVCQRGPFKRMPRPPGIPRTPRTLRTLGMPPPPCVSLGHRPRWSHS